MSADPLDDICAIIQEDVGNRGSRSDPVENLISATMGDFHAACRSIAETAHATIAIITGFFIAHAHPPCAETDGPLGALFLARALAPLDIRVVLASDAFCIPALEAGLAAAGLDKGVPLITLPSVELSNSEYWRYFRDRSGEITHLLALERVGPSHTPESLQAQEGNGPAALARFRNEVPAEHHDRCHSMRGRDITPHVSPAHRLFEEAARQSPRATTLGIGDGGNEIGMGKIPWVVVRRNIPNGGLVACRTPVDHLIVCGISNWGAYGLAAGVRLLCGAPPDPELFNLDRERDLLQLMIDHGPLVDGMSGEQTLSVDGFPFDRYAQPLRRLAEIH
jgi:D-glutamate cyclase